MLKTDPVFAPASPCLLDEEITDSETQDHQILDVSPYLRVLCVYVVKVFMNNRG